MARNLILLALYLSSFTAYAQLRVSPRNIPTTDTGNLSFTLRRYSLDKIDHPAISSTNNYLEIRLYSSGMPGQSCTIISFDYKEWSVKRYFSDYQPLKLLLKKDLNIPAVFDTLVANNVFTLPDLNEYQLGINNSPDDCGDNVLVYKFGDKYRYYSFYCADEYAKTYPDKIVLKYYAGILKTFGNMLGPPQTPPKEGL